MANKNSDPDKERFEDRLDSLERVVTELIAVVLGEADSDADVIGELASKPFRARTDLVLGAEEKSALIEGIESNFHSDQIRRVEGMVEQARIELYSQADKVSYQVEELESHVHELSHAFELAQAELHHSLIFQSFGEASRKIALTRFIPVRVYLSDDNHEDIEAISSSVDSLLEAFGFRVSDDFPAKKGSWWKIWYAKSKTAVSQPEVTDRLEKIERALDVTGLHKPQADMDKTKAEAIAIIVASVKDIPTIAIQVGSLLLVKHVDANGDPTLQVRTLTTKELIHLENNQQLLCEPENILKSLSSAQIESKPAEN